MIPEIACPTPQNFYFVALYDIIGKAAGTPLYSTPDSRNLQVFLRANYLNVQMNEMQKGFYL